jgi:hypothetical protein
MTRARSRRGALVHPSSPTAAAVLVASLVAALALGGCGTKRADGTGAAAPSASASAPSVSASPSASADALCPGETASPTPTSTVPPEPNAGDGPPNYADNHGFMVPIPLRGAERCEGLTQVRRVTAALDPLRDQADFATGHVRDRLIGLGYSPGSVTVSVNGPTGVSFLVDTGPICLDGTMDLATTRVDAFAGYPDSTGCTRPTGGH